MNFFFSLDKRKMLKQKSKKVKKAKRQKGKKAKRQKCVISI